MGMGRRGVRTGRLERSQTPADSHRDQRAESQQRPLRPGSAGTRPAGDPSNERGEGPHGYDAAGPEAEQVGARDGVREQGKCRQDPQQVRAAGQSVEGSHREGGTAMNVSLPGTPGLAVAAEQGDPYPPDPDPDQDEADAQLTPGGQCLDG